MDWKRKITPDHTDQAYREAVSRLRTMLSPRPQSRSSMLGSPSKADKPLINALDSSPEIPKKGLSNSIRTMFLKDANTSPSILNNNNANLYSSGLKSVSTPEYLADREDDLFGFIEKQGEYITQLEKETKYCRDELSTMLEKVREVISENEALHEQQKKDILTSMIKQLDEKTPPSLDSARQVGKKSNLVGASSVILESRVAELEAQLSQARRSLRLAQEEILNLRKGKLNELTAGGGGDSSVQNPYAQCEFHRDEIDRLAREKDEMVDTLSRLKQMMNDLKDRESDAAKKVKSSFEIIEHMRMEKDQSDMESGRLKEELDRYQKRVREMIQDHTRKLHEEKLQVERKYRLELDHLNSEMTQELDSLTKAKIDLERQKRIEGDLRRELEQRQSAIDDLRQEMQIKMGHLQKELAHALSKKSTVEQELINSRLNAEKVERDGKQDAIRLQAEINALRKRLEQSDVDLVKSQDMIAKLNEHISQFQREASMAKLRLEEHISTDPDLQDKDVMGLIQDMEEKHSRDMTELEQLIQVQNNLLDKLRGECKGLTDKLEDTHRQYKKERTVLESEREKLAQASEVSHKKSSELEQRVQFYQTSHDQMTKRLQKEDLRDGLQSCVESFRGSENAAGGTGSTADSAEVQKLQEQLDEFLRVHTDLLEELVEILHEMNECIATNELKPEVKNEEEKEKEGEEKIAEEEQKEELAGEEVADVSEKAEEEKGEKLAEGAEQEENKNGEDEKEEDKEAGDKKEKEEGAEAEEGKDKDETEAEAESAGETKEEEKIFQLLSKQSGLLKENQTLQGEVALLRNRLAEAQQQHQQSANTTNRGM